MKRIVAHLGALSRQLTQLDGNEFVLIAPDCFFVSPRMEFHIRFFLLGSLLSFSLLSPPSVEYDRTG